jgi:hypothetical protein
MTVSVLGIATTAPEMSGSSPNFLRPVRAVFYHLFQVLHKLLITSPWFRRSLVTSVGGTTSVGPEFAAKFSGGGFSDYFERPHFQDSAVEGFFKQFGDTQYAGLYEYVRCRGLTWDLFLIYDCAALRGAASPTSPHKRLISQSSSTTLKLPWPVRAARRPCVFPCFSLLSVSSILKRLANRQCPDSCGHNLAAK